MNAQKLDQNKNRLSYQKDYSKLESIFDAAVERMHRKKIIYYATDRIYSDDSRKIRARETYKEVAWAKPLSSEDVKTEVIQLAKDNVIPISDTILNDDVSLRSILELVGEDNSTTIKKQATVEETNDQIISEEPPELSSVLEANDLKKNIGEIESEDTLTETVEEVPESEPLEQIEETAEQQVLEEKAEERTNVETPLVSMFQKAQQEARAVKEAEESVRPEPPEETEAVLLSELIPEEEPETISSEEISEENTDNLEEIDLESLSEETEEPEKTYTYANISLSELIARIQEDDYYLYPESGEGEPREILLGDIPELFNSQDESTTEDEVVGEESEEIITIEETAEDSLETITADEVIDQEPIETFTEEEVIAEEPIETFAEKEVITEEPEETVESIVSFEEPLENETVELEEQPLDEFEEESLQIQDRPFDFESVEVKPKRRVKINEVDDQDLFSDKGEVKIEQQVSQSYIDKLNSARKEYMLSRISFIIALFLTGVFTVLFFHSLNGIDYFALALSVIGAVLVWDLKPKYILIMAGVMEAAIIGGMIYIVNSTGIQLDYFHYIWLLILPLLISSSFLFKKSRENYADIIKNKDVNLSVN